MYVMIVLVGQVIESYFHLFVHDVKRSRQAVWGTVGVVVRVQCLVVSISKDLPWAKLVQGSPSSASCAAKD
eukprot:5536873-Amphidinium_carterae.1